MKVNQILENRFSWDGSLPKVGDTYYLRGKVWASTLQDGKIIYPVLSAGRIKIKKIGRNGDVIHFTYGGREYWTKVYKLMNNVALEPNPQDKRFLSSLLVREETEDGFGGDMDDVRLPTLLRADKEDFIKSTATKAERDRKFLQSLKDDE